MKLIIVTSPATDAGKTWLSAGIAEAATAACLRTLFVDFDNPVGDSLRVFGIIPGAIYPTIASWREFPDPWEIALKTTSGTNILPKPDYLSENISLENVRDLLKMAQEFDLVVADLGTDYKAEFWSYLVDEADLAILVSDRDDKAAYRIKQFLATITTEREWLLVINSREKEGYYTTNQVARMLDADIPNIIEFPYYPDAEKRIPKTFSPDNPFAKQIINMVFKAHTPRSKVQFTSKKRHKQRKPCSWFQAVHRLFKFKNSGSKTSNQMLTIIRSLNVPVIKSGYLLDTSGEYSYRLNSNDIWKSDWRLGRQAEPFKHKGVLVFAFSQELGDQIDTRDQDVLIEQIEYLIGKGPVYVIDATGRFRSELIHLGAVEL